MAAQHNAQPFGSIASVHNWNRVGMSVLAQIIPVSLLIITDVVGSGEFIAAIARRLLHLPVLRSVVLACCSCSPRFLL